jgi:acetyl esterase/lipase
VPFPRQVPYIPRRSEYHELREDVVYAEADGVPLRFDHYRPLKASVPAPAVVLVHGGAWMHGDPSQAAGNALHFARHGIATISLSYRLAPAHRFPAPVHDVRHGLRWVRAHAAELGIDTDRLALFGLSAGAHLALMAHLAPGVPELPMDFSPPLADVPEEVRAIMLHYGPYDLARARPFPDGVDPAGELLGTRRSETAWVRAASPLHHAAHVRAPVLLIHGTADAVVSYRESARMHDALVAGGKPSALLLLEGAPHAFQIEWRGEANRRANDAMDAFLTQHLGG